MKGGGVIIIVGNQTSLIILEQTSEVSSHVMTAAPRKDAPLVIRYNQFSFWWDRLHM